MGHRVSDPTITGLGGGGGGDGGGGEFYPCLLFLPLQKAFGAVLKYDPSLCVLAYCLDHQSTRIKILILKVSKCTVLSFY